MIIMSQALKLFRTISYIEGLSFLLLLGIAMPLKYMFEMPMPVTVTGWIHGILFILYFVVLAYVMFVEKWSFVKAVIAAIASVIPFGPFIFDAKLIKQEPNTKSM
jgi:integral membrane protein